jgi:hypothetical protein
MIVNVVVAMSTYFIVSHFFPEKPKKPELEPDSNIDVRGGDLNGPKRVLLVKRVWEFVSNDNAMKAGILSLVFLTINRELVDDLCESLLKSSPSFIASEHNKNELLKLSPATKKIFLSDLADDNFKRVALTKEIEKLSPIEDSKLRGRFLIRKIKFLIKGENLEREKKIQAILMCTSLILYLASGDSIPFTAFFMLVRKLLNNTVVPEDLDDHLN